MSDRLDSDRLARMTKLRLTPFLILLLLLFVLYRPAWSADSLEFHAMNASASYRVVKSDCLHLTFSRVVWSEKDKICIQTAENEAPDQLSHFLVIQRDGQSESFILLNPEYSSVQHEGKNLPALSYQIVSTSQDRISFGTIEVVFKSDLDMEEFKVFFYKGTTPDGLYFYTKKVN